MMKYLWMVAIAIIVLLNCQTFAKDEGFVLKGNITGLTAKWVHMKYRYADVEHHDSSEVKKGTFEFRGKVDGPEFVIVFSAEARFQKVFYAENVAMELKGSADSLQNLVVTGSPVQNDYMVLEKIIDNYRKGIIALYDQSEKARAAGDTKKADSLRKLADEKYRAEAGVRKQFIVDHMTSYASLNELLNWTSPENYREAGVLLSQMNESLRTSRKGKEIQERIRNLESTQVGRTFIDFTMNDFSQKPISLSSYRGKYVLLEFWASWCGPCRAENPNLREQYTKFKDKGFDILGVSLDDKADRWKAALEKDDLPWTQVSDLKGWNNVVAVQYGIRAIPANFLISPDGIIVARDLRGEALNKKLTEIFGTSKK